MRTWGLLACACVLVLAGCSSRAETADRGERYAAYAALGDSYTSGAGMPEPVAGTEACLQSALSYPYLVADELGASLADASCGGASTVNTREPQPRADGGAQPAQLNAVRAETDLVTVGLGFNDSNFYARLMSCTGLVYSDPQGTPCQAAEPGLAQLPVEAGRHLRRVLTDIHAAAPEAEVVVVGYPQLVPERGTCPELSLAVGDYPWARALLVALDDELEAATEAVGDTFVDVQTASEGHDICAGANAWVAGVGGSEDQTAQFHPRPAAHRAIASMVLAALEG